MATYYSPVSASLALNQLATDRNNAIADRQNTQRAQYNPIGSALATSTPPSNTQIPTQNISYQQQQTEPIEHNRSGQFQAAADTPTWSAANQWCTQQGRGGAVWWQGEWRCYRDIDTTPNRDTNVEKNRWCQEQGWGYYQWWTGECSNAPQHDQQDNTAPQNDQQDNTAPQHDQQDNTNNNEENPGSGCGSYGTQYERNQCCRQNGLGLYWWPSLGRCGQEDPDNPGNQRDYNPEVEGAKEQCANNGGVWVSTGLMGQGYCQTSPSGQLPGAPWDQYTQINPDDLQVGGNQQGLPWMQTGAYTDYLAQMLSNPAFGGQTLEELENARIQALQGDLANQYGYQADELQRRINQEAAAQGMFTSGARTGAIGSGLSELGRQQQVEFAKGAADIRAQRPELLLQERQQRQEIANTWGQLDLDAKRTNLDAFLQNNLQEYERQFRNSQLTLEAFNGNMNILSLFLDYMVSAAQTNSEIAFITARIDDMYNSMSNDDRAQFLDWISAMMGGFGGLIGGA